MPSLESRNEIQNTRAFSKVNDKSKLNNSENHIGDGDISFNVDFIPETMIQEFSYLYITCFHYV